MSGRIGFELWLPEALADGTIHRIRVVAHNDIELAGSPVSILAFPDGLVSFLAKTAIGTADKARLEFLEKLLPMSLPFSGFSEWQRRFPLPVTTNPAHGSTAVVLVGYGNPDHSLASLATQPSHQRWTAVVLPPADIIGDAFDPADLIHFLEQRVLIPVSWFLPAAAQLSHKKGFHAFTTF